MDYNELHFVPVLPGSYMIEAEIFPWNERPQRVFDMYKMRYLVTDEENRIIVRDKCGGVSVTNVESFCRSYVRIGGQPFYEDRLDWYPWFRRPKKIRGWKQGGGYLLWAAHVTGYHGVISSRSGLGHCGPTLEVNKSSCLHGDGDWIVCSDEEGRPDIRDAYVTSGFMFDVRYRIISQNDVWRYASRRDGFGRLVDPCRRPPF